MSQPVVSRDPDIMGGAAVFGGTHVPVQTLLDYLETGDSIDEFLEERKIGLSNPWRENPS